MLRHLVNLFGRAPDPDERESYCVFLYDEPEEYQVAIKTILININRGKGNTHHFNNLGVLYWETGEIEKALDSFNKSIQLDKKNAVPYKNLGMYEEKQGNLELALSYFGQAVNAKPNDYSINLNNAYVLLDLGRPHDAIPYFLTAIKLGFNNDIVSNKLAEAYAQIGDTKNAQHYEQLAKKLD